MFFCSFLPLFTLLARFLSQKPTPERDQTRRHLPLTHVLASTTHLSPVSKMGREGIEVEVEPITGEKRKTAWGQHLSQRVNHRMGHVLGAGTQLEDGQNLGARVDRHPQPEHV